MMENTANKVTAEAKRMNWPSKFERLLSLHSAVNPLQGEAEFRTYTKFENFCTSDPRIESQWENEQY
jgi:hypothetical protein